MSENQDLEQDFQAGDQVRLMNTLPYVKTADPMPMLRPPNVVSIGEEGTIIDRRPGGYWGVRFSKGIFLMESRNLELAVDELAEETDAADDETDSASESETDEATSED